MRTWLLGAIGVAVAAVLVGAAIAPDHAVKLKPASIRVLIAGDSLTAGFYSTTEATSFRALVVAGLKHPVRVGTAIGGATLAEVAGLTEFPADLDMVVIELGTNDVGTTDLTVFDAQYQQLLERLRAATPDAVLICLGTWRIDGASGYDAAIRDRCEAANGTYVTLQPVMATAGTRGGETSWWGTPDTFHPNDLGHQMIAERVLTAVPQWLDWRVSAPQAP